MIKKLRENSLAFTQTKIFNILKFFGGPYFPTQEFQLGKQNGFSSVIEMFQTLTKINNNSKALPE